jgi:hypothetical protein
MAMIMRGTAQAVALSVCVNCNGFFFCLLFLSVSVPAGR